MLIKDREALIEKEKRKKIESNMVKFKGDRPNSS